MQVILAFLGAAACIALGMLAADRLSQRDHMLHAWECALQRMEAAVSVGGLNLPGVLLKGAGENVPMLAQAAMYLKNEPSLSHQALIARLDWAGLFTPAEREILQECLTGLFAPTQQMQLQALQYAKEQWALFRRIGREARENNARLYASLGWLAGAAVFILMC